MAGKYPNWAVLVGAPAAASCATVAMQFATAPLRGAAWSSFDWIGNVSSLLVGSLFLICTLGVGIHKFARWRRFSGPHLYWLAGGCIGAFFAVASIAYTRLALANPTPLELLDFNHDHYFQLSHAWPLMALNVGRYTIAGALTGLFAWFVHRPDRDGAPAPNPATATP